MALTPSTIRIDLKCGNGAVSPGEKCHKGQAQKVAPQKGVLAYKQTHKGLKEEAFGKINGKVLSNRQVRQVERGILSIERRTGKMPKLTEAQRAALLATRGTQHRKVGLHLLSSVPSKALKASIKATKNTSNPSNFAVRQAAKRELFNRRVRTGARALGVGLAVGAITASTIETRRRDAIWADGFSLDTAALEA